MKGNIAKVIAIGLKNSNAAFLYFYLRVSFIVLLSTSNFNKGVILSVGVILIILFSISNSPRWL